MKKYKINLYVSAYLRATVEAENEDQAKELMLYAYDFDSCNTDVYETDILSIEKTKKESVGYPLLNVEWCRKGVLEDMKEQAECNE